VAVVWRCHRDASARAHLEPDGGGQRHQRDTTTAKTNIGAGIVAAQNALLERMGPNGERDVISRTAKTPRRRHRPPKPRRAAKAAGIRIINRRLRQHSDRT